MKRPAEPAQRVERASQHRQARSPPGTKLTKAWKRNWGSQVLFANIGLCASINQAEAFRSQANKKSKETTRPVAQAWRHSKSWPNKTSGSRWAVPWQTSSGSSYHGWDGSLCCALPTPAIQPFLLKCNVRCLRSLSPALGSKCRSRFSTVTVLTSAVPFASAVPVLQCLCVTFFPECVARFPFHLGGLGVRLCSPKVAFATATVGNRPQPSATVRNRLRDRRKALHSGECIRTGPESVWSWSVVVAEEVSVWLIGFAAVILVFAEEVSVWVVSVAAVISVFAEEVSVRMICAAAVILVCVEGVSVRVVSAAAGILVFAEEVSVWVICVAAVILVCAEEGGVCESDLWRRSFIGVCRGGVCENDLCRRSYIGVCTGRVCVSGPCRRSYIRVCRGGVCENDLCRRSYIGVCRGGVCENDLWRRRYIGVCKGGVCVSDLCQVRVSYKSVK